MNEAVYHAILRRLGLEPVEAEDGLGVGTPSAPDPAEVARVLGLPLPQLDRLLEVRVSWLPVTLWFVPGEAQTEGLLAEGVSRGRIWTAGELLDLLSISLRPAPGPSPSPSSGSTAKSPASSGRPPWSHGRPGDTGDARPPVNPGRGAASWPRRIPGLGPRTLIPYATCRDCVDHGGRHRRVSAPEFHG